MSCTYTLCLADFECLVLSELVIDCVSGYVSALLKLTGGFCCWHGTLLEWSMPRACVEDQSPSQGSGQRNSGRRDCGHVFGNPVRYSLSFWYGTSSNNSAEQSMAAS